MSTYKNIVITIALIALFVCVSFISIVAERDSKYELKYPAWFPKPQIPEDNQLTTTRVRLGKLLFYDKNLSGDRTVSCSSCHSPEFAFSDSAAFSKGVHNTDGDRNAMPLINMAWSNSMFWDGNVSTLEQQAKKPLLNPKEMNISIEEAVKRVKENSLYRKLFKQAYGSSPDSTNIFKAIACFERTLVSGNSKFDRYFYMKDTSAFNASEKRGFNLFFTREKVTCASCHMGANFTSHSFQNNGLYEEYPDQGRYKVTSRESDKGRFKVPTLRNIALTAPYMHDGSLRTLEEVVEHYSIGGKPHMNRSTHVHIHPGMRKMNTQDKEDLVNFLKTLTDEEFVGNPEFRM